MVELENKKSKISLLKTAVEMTRNKRWAMAAERFRKAWSVAPQSFQFKHLFYYSRALNELNKHRESLKFAELAHEKEPHNEQNNLLFAWNLFELFVRNHHYNEKMHHSFMAAATRITQLCRDEQGSPFKTTVLIVLDCLAGMKVVDGQAMLDWTSHLQPLQLSNIPQYVPREPQKILSFASPSAKYYRFKSQALYALGRFNECANLIEEAFEELQDNVGHVRVELVERLARCFAHLGLSDEIARLRKKYGNKLVNPFWDQLSVEIPLSPATEQRIS